MSLYQQLTSWQVIGTTVLAANAANTSIITIPPMDLIRITVRVVGYTGNGIASLRFGGTAGAVDSGSNYQWRIEDAQVNSNNMTTTEGISATLMQVASTATTLPRVATITISNFATVNKICKIDSATNAGNASTRSLTSFGQGVWANTTQQIIAVQLLATANSLLAGTGFVIEGMNLS